MKIFVPLCAVVLLAGWRAMGQSSDALREGLAKEDLAAIRTAVRAARATLGDKAGEPEVADTYVPIPTNGGWLTPSEAQRGFAPDLAKLEKLITWRIGLDPTQMNQPLRAPASVLSGCIAICRAHLDGAEQCEKIARQTADFLIWTQEQAGSGLYPFPAARGTSSAKAMEVATRFLERAEKAGKLDQVVHNGWACDDLGDGGLQFDNAECGVAMLELYEFTKDPRDLASARRAADWAMARPLCTNWNYNSFSVWLLAKAFAITGEESYRVAAVKKATLGVIPGQLTDGPHVGRWVDAHNARPAYHYIMLRALAQLAAIVPPSDSSREEIVKALALGLKARNSEILTRGAMNKDKAIEALLLVNRLFASDAALLQRTDSAAALDALGKLISEQSRRGKQPLGPREWGLFLAAARSR